MTIQELINALQEQPNKEREIMVWDYEKGTHESIHNVSLYDDSKPEDSNNILAININY